MERLRHATLQVKIIVVSMLTSAGAVCLTFGPIVAYELVTAERGITHNLTEMAILLVVVLVLSCGAAYLTASRLQYVISAPILTLAETASQVSRQKDYSIRATKAGDDEVGVLVDRFNEMLMQIETF